jgi:ABC-type multidrug transport system fused ATPase/permease subunit
MLSVSKIKFKIQETLSPLNGQQKIKIFILVMLNLFCSIIELISLSAIFPVISVLFDVNFQNNRFVIFFNLVSFSKEQILFYFCIIILIIFILRFFIIFLIKYLNYKYIFNIQKYLTKKVYLKLLNSDYLSYIESSNTGTLRASLDETRHYTMGLLLSFSNFLIEIIFLSLIFISALLISPKISLTFFVFGSFVILIYLKITRTKLINSGYLRIKLDDLIYNHVSNTFENLRDIKVYNKQNIFFSKFDSLNNKIYKNNLLMQSIQIIPSLLFELLAISLLVILLLVLIKLQYEPEFFAPIISMIVLTTIRILPSVSRIIVNIQNISMTIGSATKINFYLNTNNKLKNIKNKSSNLKKLSLNKFTIQYKNKNIILNSNIKFSKSEITGIIGPSGSGKTSIINVLLGLISLRGGFIKINNQKSDIEQIYNNISIVSKDNYLINDTIRENILFGNKYEKNKFQKTLEISILKPIIDDLPDGMFTNIGSKGLKFSDGQKQRLSIARAIYNSKKILIFDEATNSLDNVTRNKFMKNLYNLRNDKIIIIVSHDRRLIRKYCSCIYEIKNRKVLKIK